MLVDMSVDVLDCNRSVLVRRIVQFIALLVFCLLQQLLLLLLHPLVLVLYCLHQRSLCCRKLPPSVPHT